MKKVVSLALALILCFSLAACGNSGNENTTTIGAVSPDNDAEIPTATDTSMDDTKTQDETQTDSAAEDTETDTAPVSSHPMLPYLYGKWEQTIAEDNEKNPYTILEVRKDGTCVMDGKECHWEIFDETKGDLLINIRVDGQKIAGAVIFANEDGSFGSFMAMTEEDFSFCHGAWINTSVNH